MPLGLIRHHASNSSHFLTFSCYKRAPLLVPELRDELLHALERTRVRYMFRVYGYVLMPEHVQLMISEPEVGTVAPVIQALKVSVIPHTTNTRLYGHPDVDTSR